MNLKDTLDVEREKALKTDFCRVIPFDRFKEVVDSLRRGDRLPIRTKTVELDIPVGSERLHRFVYDGVRLVTRTDKPYSESCVV